MAAPTLERRSLWVSTTVTPTSSPGRASWSWCMTLWEERARPALSPTWSSTWPWWWLCRRTFSAGQYFNVIQRTNNGLVFFGLKCFAQNTFIGTFKKSDLRSNLVLIQCPHCRTSILVYSFFVLFDLEVDVKSQLLARNLVNLKEEKQKEKGARNRGHLKCFI